MDSRKKTLLNLIGAGLIALGSAGLLTGLTGCATSSDTRALASLTRAAAINSNDYERAQRLGKYSEFLDAWGFLQQSDERKSQSNWPPEHVICDGKKCWPEPGYRWVDPTAPGLAKYRVEKIPEKKQFFFAYNKWVDFDGDGVRGYPDEFIGIKKNFREDESICVMSYDEKAIPGQKWEIALYNHEGKELYRNSRKYGGFNEISGICADPYDFKPGSYKAVFKVDGEFIGSTDFNVLPAESSANK